MQVFGTRQMRTQPRHDYSNVGFFAHKSNMDKNKTKESKGGVLLTYRTIGVSLTAS